MLPQTCFAAKLNGLICHKLALCSPSKATGFNGCASPNHPHLSTLSESFNLFWSIKNVWSSWMLYTVLSVISCRSIISWTVVISSWRQAVPLPNFMLKCCPVPLFTLQSNISFSPFPMRCKVTGMKKHGKRAADHSVHVCYNANPSPHSRARGQARAFPQAWNQTLEK